MSNPLVSIIMPVYNVASYVNEAIESILSQTLKNFELIIINDASTDNTEQVIFKAKDKRLVYVKNDSNLKIVETLNKGLDIARGEFIARMDGDDISTPERLQKQFEFLKKNSDIGICGTALEKFGVVRKVVRAVEEPEEIKFCLALNTTMPHATIMARAALFKEHDIRYLNEFIYAEDYSLFSRLSAYSRMANLPDVLYRYRIHAQNSSSEKADLVKKNAAKVRLQYLKKNLSNKYSEDLLIRAANCWSLNDETLKEDEVFSILEIYKSWYDIAFETTPLSKNSICQNIINEYFMYLLIHKAEKGRWKIPIFSQSSFFKFTDFQRFRAITRTLIKG